MHIYLGHSYSISPVILGAEVAYYDLWYFDLDRVVADSRSIERLARGLLQITRRWSQALFKFAARSVLSDNDAGNSE